MVINQSDAGMPGIEQLETPQNVAVVGTSLLVWSDVTDAIGYAIYINDVIWTQVLANFIDLRHFADGMYRINIRAVGSQQIDDSPLSPQITHRVGNAMTETRPAPRAPEIPDADDVVRLTSPAYVRKIDESLITWNHSLDAHSYAVYLNGEAVASITENFWDFGDELIPGTHIISVRALSDETERVNSHLSNGVVFSVSASPALFTSTPNSSWLQNDVVIFALFGISLLAVLSLFVGKVQLKVKKSK